MEAQAKELERKDKLMKAEVVSHKARVADLLEQLARMRAESLRLENKIARMKAKSKAKKEMIKQGNVLVTDALDKHEQKQNAAINRNNMIGEDFRSQALLNYHKILELQELVLYLRAEPYVVKQKNLQLLTRLRREGERHAMELEERRLEQEQFMRQMEKKDEVVEELNRRHEEHAYLIKVIRRKLGNDFAIAHAFTNTETEYAKKLVQTDYPANHVSIQAHGFNQREIGFTTEPQLDDEGSDLASSHLRMTRKKLLKKKIKQGGSGSSKSPGLRRQATRRSAA